MKTVLLVALLVFGGCDRVNKALYTACEWREQPADFFFPVQWFCVTQSGEVVGKVNQGRSESVWHSFDHGAYCGSGSGYISEQAAKGCINKLYNTTEATSEAGKR